MQRDTSAESIAAGLLSQQFSQPIRLGAGTRLRSSDRSQVYRCSLIDAPPGAPASVILKRATRPYGATAAGAVDGSVWQDWAGLRLLGDLSAGDPLAPRCYTGDQAAGLIVLEDIGAVPNLRDALAGDDTAQAGQGLVQLFATLGKLHARTHGHQALFLNIRATLGPYEPELDWYRHRYAQLSWQFQDMLRQVQVEPAPGTDADLATILDALRDPGPFLVYIHGDPTPANYLIAGGHSRLLDYEYGTYGHALLDGVQARMCFPSGPFVNRVPARIVCRAEVAYRAELARGCPAAADDTLFAQATTIGCAYWAIGFLSWLPFAEVLAADRQWGNATIRQRFILFAEVFVETAQESGYLEALCTSMRAFVHRLRQLWPEAADMPLYPVFRGEAP
jgi:hypothetical protein